MKVNLRLGDALLVLAELENESVDSIVTDPPYGIAFMGKKWDYDVPSQAIWEECLRVLKPGGHLLAFAGSRTYHRMAVRIEDAGFEIRDQMMWLYGSGFPKSMDVSKAIDKSAGGVPDILAPATEAAKQWEGWGSALKPAHEPIVMARKPFKGSLTKNVLENGTGALNIDACRIPTKDDLNGGAYRGAFSKDTDNAPSFVTGKCETKYAQPLGRWPANVIHDGCECVAELFPEDKDRFFYCAKPSTSERHLGCDNPGTQFKHGDTLRKVENTATSGNTHPTVKPIALMKHLVELVTPPGGLVLDPFMGSGTTGMAAVELERNFIGIEMEPEFFDIAFNRVNYARKQKANA